jgi:hypothetical protein
MRWDFQHQCSIPLLSACLCHRNNSARTALMASSCYLRCHGITFTFIFVFVFNFVFVFSLVVTVSSSFCRLGAYHSAVCSQRVCERME